MTVGHAVPFSNWSDKKNAPKAVLICVHGLCLHAGTYKPFGEVMAKLRIAVYAFDVRGFGAKRHCNLNFPACLTDLKWQIDELRGRHPGLPVFLLGESLGGAISTRYAVEYKGTIDGLILCAPASTPFNYKWEALWAVRKFLSSPNRRVCLRESVFRHSPNLLAFETIQADLRTEFSARELWHLALFLSSCSNDVSKIGDIPILFIQGQRDLLVKPRSTIRYFERLPALDKDLVIIGDAHHLIFQSSVVPRKAVYLVKNWIVDHLPNQTANRVA